MSLIIIGLGVGFVLALTGAGGAILAIPLFMDLLDMSVKQATTASLLVVAMGAVIGAFFQDSKINLKIVFILFSTSIIGAWISYPIKLLVPSIIIKFVLAVLAIYSLYVMWRPKLLESNIDSKPIWWQLLGGFFLGGLTTLTGLGGGVVLLPWLRVTLGKTDVATSLATIALISSFSFGMQMALGAKIPSPFDIFLIFISLCCAVFLLKLLMQRLPQEVIERIRLSVFSSVVLFTLVTLFGK